MPKLELQQISDAATQMGYETERTDEQVTVYVHDGCLIVYQDDDGGDWVVESCWDSIWVGETDDDPTSTHCRSPEFVIALGVMIDLLLKTQA